MMAALPGSLPLIGNPTLRIADRRQSTQRKGGDEGKGSNLLGPTEESEVWSI